MSLCKYVALDLGFSAANELDYRVSKILHELKECLYAYSPDGERLSVFHFKFSMECIKAVA